MNQSNTTVEQNTTCTVYCIQTPLRAVEVWGVSKECAIRVIMIEVIMVTVLSHFSVICEHHGMLSNHRLQLIVAGPSDSLGVHLMHVAADIVWQPHGMQSICPVMQLGDTYGL